jgi:hypothetical protein
MELELVIKQDTNWWDVDNYTSAATGFTYSKRGVAVRLRFIMENFMKMEQVEVYSGTVF